VPDRRVVAVMEDRAHLERGLRLAERGEARREDPMEGDQPRRPSRRRSVRW
jgi:hypothetical protein